MFNLIFRGCVAWVHHACALVGGCVHHAFACVGEC